MMNMSIYIKGVFNAKYVNKYLVERIKNVDLMLSSIEVNNVKWCEFTYDDLVLINHALQIYKLSLKKCLNFRLKERL